MYRHPCECSRLCALVGVQCSGRIRSGPQSSPLFATRFGGCGARASKCSPHLPSLHRNTLGLRNRVWIFMLVRGIKLPSLPLSIRHFTYGAVSRSQRVLLGKEGAPSSATERDRVGPNTATAVLLWPHNSAQFSSVYPCPEIKTREPHLQQLLWERMAELRLPQRSVGVLRPRVGELDREHKRGIWKRSSVPRSKERSHSIAALPNPKALRIGEKSSARHQEAHG